MRFFNYRKMKLINSIFVIGSLFFATACSVNPTAKQPYRTKDGESYLISSTSQGGKLKIWINEQQLLDEVMLNQNTSLSQIFVTDFTNVYERTYNGKHILIRCSRDQHFSGVDYQCDVFIDNEYAANLILK